MAAARVLSIQGVVYCDNEAPLEERLSVELSTPQGDLICGTMTGSDGSFFLSPDAGVLLCWREILVSVWRGAVRVKEVRMTTRDALSRNVWLPIEGTYSIIKVTGTLRDSDGEPASGRRIRIRRVVSRPDGRLMKMKIGQGHTDDAGIFTVTCAVPRNSAAPLIQIQAFDGDTSPAVCAMIHQTALPLSPVNLVLPCEEPTLILDGMPELLLRA